MPGRNGFDRHGGRLSGKVFKEAPRRNVGKKPLLKMHSSSGSLRAADGKIASCLPPTRVTRFATMGGSEKLATHMRRR
eukprot:14027162-Heterocapsa_arctica.AAC.1